MINKAVVLGLFIVILASLLAGNVERFVQHEFAQLDQQFRSAQ